MLEAVQDVLMGSGQGRQELGCLPALGELALAWLEKAGKNRGTRCITKLATLW